MEIKNDESQTTDIFYSQEAANAAVNLKRWDTACNVGIITITAFALGFSGAFKGIVTAGKGIYAGFADFGFKIGMTNLLKMGSSGILSYIGREVIDTYIVKPLKQTLIYEPLGIDVNPTDTNIQNIKNNNLDSDVNKPDKILVDATTTIDNSNAGNGVSGHKTTNQSYYEVYTCKEVTVPK